jgi:hemolysin type calcium-binding protein
MRFAGALLASLLLLAGTAGAARIVGTSGNDLLSGTPRADTILGREGRDRLTGGVGADFLHGGPGKDLIDGGPGSDRIAVQYDGARDSVRCGPGADVVNADLLDEVTADCELVSRRLSRDSYQDPGSQHETEVEPDSLTVGRTTVTAFQVGRRFSGAATNIGYAVSTDDGRTWRSGFLPGLTLASSPAGPNERASDPVVAYDATNRVWLIATLALEGQTTRLTVSRSTDGAKWDHPVDAAVSTAGGISFDKEWIICDNGSSSPFKGRCYLVYTDTLRADSLGVSFSTDGGLTWSPPAHVAVTDAVGAFPVIRANGELVVPFLWAGRRIGSTLSTDGGATFGLPVLVADISARNVRDLRFFPLPSADVDPSGRVWVAWHDCRSGAGCEANSAVVATSADGGRTWTAPAAVTSGRNAMLPAIGIHLTTGRVAVAYHVVRPDGGIDVELVELGPDRRRLSPPRRLTSQTMRPDWLSDTTSGRMLADYISVHYSGARPLVVWVLASEPVGSSLRQAVYATRG